jgi:surface antigen
MKTTKFIAVALTATMLTACTQPNGAPNTGIMNGGGLNKQDIGTGIGAIGGGVIGSTMGRGAGRTAATIGGALLGGVLGNQVGKSLDNADMAAYNQASQRAMETAQPGQTMPWKNPQSGNSGTVTPSGYYQNANGQYCREYTQTINVGGQSQQGHGTACREQDGSWKIVE